MEGGGEADTAGEAWGYRGNSFGGYFCGVCPLGFWRGSHRASGGRTLSAIPSAQQPKAAPSVPFITAAIAEGLSTLVNWSPDASIDDVTSYSLSASVAKGFTGTVSSKCSSPKVLTAPGTDSSALYPKLCAGIPYTITMTATNAAGTSGSSAPSDTVVPLVAQPPSSPLISSVLVRSSSRHRHWSAPAVDGGKVLESYSLSATAGSQDIKVSATASTSLATIGGLTNGTSYTLSLTATSAAGTSTPSTAINSLRYVATPCPDEPRGGPEEGKARRHLVSAPRPGE